MSAPSHATSSARPISGTGPYAGAPGRNAGPTAPDRGFAERAQREAPPRPAPDPRAASRVAEPSMEELLASIRRIIAEEDLSSAMVPPPPAGEPFSPRAFDRPAPGPRPDPRAQELRAQELRERETRERASRIQDARAQDARLQETRAREARAQDLRDREAREREWRELDARVQESRRQAPPAHEPPREAWRPHEPEPMAPESLGHAAMGRGHPAEVHADAYEAYAEAPGHGGMNGAPEPGIRANGAAGAAQREQRAPLAEAEYWPAQPEAPRAWADAAGAHRAPPPADERDPLAAYREPARRIYQSRVPAEAGPDRASAEVAAPPAPQPPREVPLRRVEARAAEPAARPVRREAAARPAGVAAPAAVPPASGRLVDPRAAEPRRESAPVWASAGPERVAPPKELLAPGVNAALTAAFQALGDLNLPQQPRTVEDLVKEVLRPMLKDWLDHNLPSLVEEIVRAQIERVSRNPRG